VTFLLLYIFISVLGSFSDPATSFPQPSQTQMMLWDHALVRSARVTPAELYRGSRGRTLKFCRRGSPPLLRLTHWTSHSLPHMVGPMDIFFLLLTLTKVPGPVNLLIYSLVWKCLGSLRLSSLSFFYYSCLILRVPPLSSPTLLLPPPLNSQGTDLIN